MFNNGYQILSNILLLNYIDTNILKFINFKYICLHTLYINLLKTINVLLYIKLPACLFLSVTLLVYRDHLIRRTN